MLLAWLLQASPEFKGIKTLNAAIQVNSGSFKPALNSKGLRLGQLGEPINPHASSQP